MELLSHRVRIITARSQKWLQQSFERQVGFKEEKMGEWGPVGRGAEQLQEGLESESAVKEPHRSREVTIMMITTVDIY